MFTVTFVHAQTGNTEVSQYFSSIKAAQKWVKWMLTQKWVAQVSLYRGQAGEELLERVAN